MSPAFSSRRLEALRPLVQQIVDDCLDRMEEKGPPVSLIEELAALTPVTVICHILGVPLEDHPKFRQWSERQLSSTAYSQEEINEAGMALAGYLVGLIAQRRATPTDDVLGALVAARDDGGDRLTEMELVITGINLLVAGHETTSKMISHVVYNLLTHQDQLDKLLADPNLLDPAIEELLRFTPLHASASPTPWIATEDVQVGSVLVREGESVLIDMGAANRDETIFDRPDELDLTRQPKPHLTFGHGVHFCIAAQLGRMELKIVVETLLRRLPSIRLAKPVEELQFADGGLLRFLTELPVAW
jgi:cytochrome P450